MIRIVMIFDPAVCDLPPVIEEYNEADALRALQGVLAAMRDAPDVSSVSLQRVTQWWPTTWQQVLTSCEVQAPDGSTWVVAKGLSAASPHEVEIYKFGQPDLRHTFTPQYAQPVQARFTHEASMLALLMTELGARVIG